MPINEYVLRLVADRLKYMSGDEDLCRPHRTGRVLSFSCPDVIAPLRALNEICENKPLRKREDAQKILGWHKAHDVTDTVVYTEDVFEALGYALDTIDITAGRGGELIHDLSDPLPDDWPGRGKYDLVYDNISHQCFNIAQCWRNAIEACRVGGYVVSVTPITMPNTGFWGVSPTAYHDFFEANGFEVSGRKAVVGKYVKLKEVDAHPFIRIRDLPDDTINVVVGRKLYACHRPVWPIMTKFRQYPNAHR